jgi:hypothetical protein
MERREIIARKAGFGIARTMNRARIVCHSGDAALIKAMDENAISIHAAFLLSQCRADIRAEILSMPVARRRLLLREMRCPQEIAVLRAITTLADTDVTPEDLLKTTGQDADGLRELVHKAWITLSEFLVAMDGANVGNG